MNRESEKIARYADIFAALGTEPTSLSWTEAHAV